MWVIGRRSRFYAVIILVGLLLAPAPVEAVGRGHCVSKCHADFTVCIATHYNPADEGASAEGTCHPSLLECTQNCAIKSILDGMGLLTLHAAFGGPDAGEDIADHVAIRSVRRLRRATKRRAGGLNRAVRNFSKGSAYMSEALAIAQAEGASPDLIAQLTAFHDNAGDLTSGLSEVTSRGCYLGAAVGVGGALPSLQGEFVLSEIAGPVSSAVSQEAEGIPKLARKLRRAIRSYTQGDQVFERSIDATQGQLLRLQKRLARFAERNILDAGLADEMIQHLQGAAEDLSEGAYLRNCFRGPPSCTDGLRNQDESDIDCGGTSCDACATGETCLVDADCSSQQCFGNLCLPEDVPNPDVMAVYVSESAPEGVQIVAADLIFYLTAMGKNASIRDSSGAIECAPGEARILLVGEEVGESLLDPNAAPQTFQIQERFCDAGRSISLEGSDLLGRQYAAYEWLHRLGVRFFHPEEEYIPDAPALGETPFTLTHTPAFLYRSVSLHLAHPLELGDAFRLGNEDYFDEARRYIDWQIKNLASFGTGGIGGGELRDYGQRRGFPSSTGFSLHSTQQGSNRVIDPDDPRPDTEQIAEAIDERMGEDPNQWADIFQFTFGINEFTEADADDTVRQITFIANYMAEHYPGVRVQTINHGTHAEPNPDYGVRYYDLSQFAPPNLAVQVHPLMFYDVFRPAPVYGNEDFNYLFDFMEEQAPIRKLGYFPESAWWLTFDLPVPLYLPITIEARDRDIQGIKHLLEQGLDAHRVFGSGHEWGYWQNEYCSFRMASDLDYRYTDCLRDITVTMGNAAEESHAVLMDAIAAQADVMFDAEILAYLVGTDPETELVFELGIEFHPLPPLPAAVAQWDIDQVNQFDNLIAPRLEAIDVGFSALVSRLEAVRADVPAKGASFFDEVVDGLEMFALRARHQKQAYGALIGLRRAQLEGSVPLRDQAEALLGEAKATTDEAISVVRRRENGYRYQPLSRSVAGGANGDEDSNWTTYPYRYLNRVHHAYYFTLIDQRVQDAFDGPTDVVSIVDAILGPGETLALAIGEPSLTDILVEYGDGSSEGGGPNFSHAYAVPGVYTLTVSGVLDGLPFSDSVEIAVVESEQRTGFNATIIEPAGAAILEGALPGLVVGRIDADTYAAGFSHTPDGNVLPHLWYSVGDAMSQRFIETLPRSVQVPIVTQSSGVVVTQVQMDDVVVIQETDQDPLRLNGQLDTDDIVRAVVEVAGGAFNEEGARAFVATLLGYTVETLPPSVSIIVEF